MTTTRTVTEITAELTALRATAHRYDSGANEGGEGFNPHHAALLALQAERDAAVQASEAERMAARQAATEAEWTRELTVQRRADWNAWVRSHSTQGTLAALLIAEQIKAQGWSLDELKRAITRHGL